MSKGDVVPSLELDEKMSCHSIKGLRCYPLTTVARLFDVFIQS